MLTTLYSHSLTQLLLRVLLLENLKQRQKKSRLIISPSPSSFSTVTQVNNILLEKSCLMKISKKIGRYYARQIASQPRYPLKVLVTKYKQERRDSTSQQY